MATPGYSGTALIKKLGIQPGMKVFLLNEPDDYFNLLEQDISKQLIKGKETLASFIYSQRMTRLLKKEWKKFCGLQQ